MLLAVDIGNTNVTLGVFQNDKLKARWRMATDVHRQTDEYAVLLHGMFSHQRIQASDVDQSVISSVVPPLTGVFQVASCLQLHHWY